MKRVISQDGTSIVYERTGNGPPLILVDGALCYRKSGPSASLAEVLSARFTVFTYDRRGRGESGNTDRPYTVDREVEDLEALICEAGGSAFVYGVSSGAALALEAANQGLAIRKLALFEAPFIVDTTREPIPDDYVAQLHGLLSAGRRGDAVRMFLKSVGAPAVAIAMLQFLPVWKKLKGVAHTLPYDMTILRGNQRGQPLPAGRWGAVKAQALVMDGGKSPVWMRNAARALASAIPNARLKTLPGQTHMVKAKAHAPVLVEFFSD